MRKFLLALIFVLAISAVAVFGTIFLNMKNTPETKAENIGQKEIPKNNEKEEQKQVKEEVSKKDINDRLAILKKRVKLQDLISSGDNYIDERNYMPAILSYQKAAEASPDDLSLTKKIADAYYEMYNFKKAYEYYSKIKYYPNLDKERVLYSLVNYKGVLPAWKDEIKKEINSLKLSKEDNFYYTTAIQCALDYDKCEEQFEVYFSLNPEITNEKLLRIKEAFTNYKNFQSKEPYYKATYVSSAFYQNGFYYIAIKTAEKVESLKSGYQPVLRIAALSAYAIGDYIQAKKYLLFVKKMDSHNPEISYLLARVYEKLNEKALSIVHYQKALKDGYEDINDINRRLMFIYFEHDEPEKMLTTLDAILAQDLENVTSTDYALAVYYNILHKKFEKANKYARRASSIYKDTGVFYGYQAWISLLKGTNKKADLQLINKVIKKAESIDSSAAIVLMTKGIYEYKMGNKGLALIYLKKAKAADSSWEYKEEIDYYLHKFQKSDEQSTKK